MNIDELTLGQIKQIGELLNLQWHGAHEPKIDNGMIGKYVIVRCHDAGVHAGVLMSYNGRECLLTDSRRLWYWRPANGAAFLSGVSVYGLDPSSKIGAPELRKHLTEDCEITLCTDAAEISIRGAKDYEP